jgi:hypothetical protein
VFITAVLTSGGISGRSASACWMSCWTLRKSASTCSSSRFVGVGNTWTRARRHGSVCDHSSTFTRSTPWTMIWTASSALIMRLMVTSVPTE